MSTRPTLNFPEGLVESERCHHTASKPLFGLARPTDTRKRNQRENAQRLSSSSPTKSERREVVSANCQ